MKRFLALLLSILLLAGMLPLSAFAAGSPQKNEWEGFDLFSSRVGCLVSRTMREDYLYNASLTLGEDTVVLNGEEQPLLSTGDAAPYEKDGQVMIPLRSLAGWEDSRVSYNRASQTAVLYTEENELSFTADSETAVLKEDGNVRTISLTAAPELTDGVFYVPLENAAAPLGYEVDRLGDTLSLSKPWQTMRLIVRSSGPIDTCGAVEVIEGFQDMHVLQFASEAETRSAYRKLKRRLDITSVSPDLVVTVDDADPEVPVEAAAEVSARAATRSWGPAYVGSDAFRDYLISLYEESLPAVTVAVIDTGIDTDHPFLKGRMDLVNARNFISKDSSGNLIENNTDVEDGHSHGSHVAGIVIDACPSNVTVLPIKSLDDKGNGSSLTLYNGLMYAIEQGCDVVNMSLGGSGQIADIEAAVDLAESRGVTVVAAAGNDSKNASSYFPAYIPNVITVGAIDSTGKYASYSNYGSCVDIWAPGSLIYSSVPPYTTKNTSSALYMEKSGTSMACPLVAAVAAMLRTYDPAMKPSTIDTVLQYYAAVRNIGAPSSSKSAVLQVAEMQNLDDYFALFTDSLLINWEPGYYQTSVLYLNMACAIVPKAEIHYTLDGTEPTRESPLYSNYLRLTSGARLRARAFEGSMVSNEIDNVYFISPFPESLHEQALDYADTWVYFCPDEEADYLRVSFSEDTYIPFPEAADEDYGAAIDEMQGLRMAGEDGYSILNEFSSVPTDAFLRDELAGRSIVVEGNTLYLLFVNSLTDADYGFRITNIEPLYGDRLEAPVLSGSGNVYRSLTGDEDDPYSCFYTNVSYEETKTVTITGPDGAEIWYTLDGSVPVKGQEGSLAYQGPFRVEEPTLVRARCYKDGAVESPVASEIYYASVYPESAHFAQRDIYYYYQWDYEAPEGTDYIAVTFDENTTLPEGVSSDRFFASLLVAQADDSYFMGGLEDGWAGWTVLLTGSSFSLYYNALQDVGSPPIYGFGIADITCYTAEELDPISYSTQSPTNGAVTAAVTPSVAAEITNNEGSATYTFTENGAFTFELKDDLGRTRTATATVDWIDTEAPEIELLGDDPVELKVGEEYEEPGAVVTDNSDADIQDKLQIDSSEVDAETEGTYQVTYTVTDAADNTASVTRTVEVTRPAPVYSGGGGGAAAGEEDPDEEDEPGAASERFIDVKKGAWYYDSVTYVTERGLFAGTGETTFSPDSNMTRAMMMTVLARLAGVDTGSGKNWFQAGMRWAVENGVSDGTGPESGVTREQLAAMLHRYVGEPESSAELSAFRDSSEISDYAVPALRWAVENGILFGKGNRVLDPAGKATRSEVASMLERFARKYSL